MRFFLILLLFAINGCTNNDIVYWCGDHACINKKEKESYFKENMVVEIRKMKKSKKYISDLENIQKNAGLKTESSIDKESKLTKKNVVNDQDSISNEKMLAEKAFLKQKRLIEEEKALAKQVKLEEKELKKKNKELKKQKKIDKKKAKEPIIKNYEIASTEANSETFNDILEKIYEKNSNKPFRNINNIQY